MQVHVNKMRLVNGLMPLDMNVVGAGVILELILSTVGHLAMGILKNEYVIEYIYV